MNAFVVSTHPDIFARCRPSLEKEGEELFKNNLLVMYMVSLFFFKRRERE